MEVGFLDNNSRISYPLVDGDDRSLVPAGLFPKNTLVDAGFMLGQDSGFVAGNSVMLRAVNVDASYVYLDFRCNATGMTGWRWLFAFPLASPFGCTVQTEAVPVAGGSSNPDKGWGFATCGDLTDAIALGIGVHRLGSNPRVEPALIQSLVNSCVRSINIGNVPRRCPDECCNSSSSSIPEVDAFPYATGLVGDVTFKEGYNSQVAIDNTRALIQLGAAVGAGAGVNCDDLLVLGPGSGGLIPDDGSICGDCGQYIRSINGQIAANGSLWFNGGAGTAVIPDKAKHLLTVAIGANLVCPSSSVP